MLFSEVYGAYYNTLAQILDRAVEGTLTRESLYALVQQYGFEESVLTVPEALESQTWPLLRKDLTTPLEHSPTMPLTTLQKRWLKALLSDPRIRLFDPPVEGLEDVEPLYPPGTFVYYDRYLDADPFEDPGYIKRFRCILSAIRHRRWLRVRFEGHRGLPHSWRCVPYKLEYSAKDDKFRLLSANKRESLSINLARITECFMLEPCEDQDYRPKAMKKRILVLELTDDRNALERVMLHFSHLDKETERLDNKHYKITLYYEREDETELLIRVLSFGQVLKVIFPDDFVKKLFKRLEKQKNLRTQGKNLSSQLFFHDFSLLEAYDVLVSDACCIFTGSCAYKNRPGIIPRNWCEEFTDRTEFGRRSQERCPWQKSPQTRPSFTKVPTAMQNSYWI